MDGTGADCGACREGQDAFVDLLGTAEAAVVAGERHGGVAGLGEGASAADRPAPGGTPSVGDVKRPAVECHRARSQGIRDHLNRYHFVVANR